MNNIYDYYIYKHELNCKCTSCMTKYFSSNGVPYPLDDYLKLQGKPTTFETAELIKRWF